MYNLIRFKLFLKKLDDSGKEIIITYGNDFDLNYFLVQTQFLRELGIKNINALIKFFQTYFSKYNNNKDESLINYIEENQNLVILKLFLFEKKIQINIELYQKIDIHNKQKQISLSNSCNNFNINIKQKLRNKEINSSSNNKQDNNILLTEYHISLIKKRIPFFKSQKNFKLNLIYKSSSEKEKNFHKKCDNKGSTLIIIFTKENRMFLTFNKESWKSVQKSEVNKTPWHEINVKDDDIFLFDLFSKKILKNKNKNENSFKFLEQYENYGPAYADKGLNFKILEEDKYLSIEFITKNDEENNYIKSNYNLEKNNFFHIQDYEVYNIINYDNNSD